MKFIFWFVLIGAALIAIAAHADDDTQRTSRNRAVFPTEAGAWHEAPRELPPGARFAVISGDPSEALPFTIRIDLPPGSVLFLRQRPQEQSLVVLHGVLELGSGDASHAGVMHALPSGSFLVLPGDTSRIASTRHGAIVQISGTGPLWTPLSLAASRRRSAIH